MSYLHRFNGLTLRTGDILCTRNGVPGSLFGELWRLLGRLVPGEIDHCAIYIGPGGRCVESGARGVIAFTMPGTVWEAGPLGDERLLLDELVGVAYPLARRGLSDVEEQRVREAVAAFCLDHVQQRTPYNPNFFNADTDGALYCSQLVYKAYLPHGIDLNSGARVTGDSLARRIVFPEDIWHTCAGRRVALKGGRMAGDRALP